MKNNVKETTITTVRMAAQAPVPQGGGGRNSIRGRERVGNAAVTETPTRCSVELAPYTLMSSNRSFSCGRYVSDVGPEYSGIFSSRSL